jgi:hypothetical protein
LTCRIAAAAAFAALLLLLPAAIGAADPGVTPVQHGIAGAVPADGPGPGNSGQGNAYGHCKQGDCVNLEASGAGLGSGNLTYHGGPVMHSNTTYLIFWSPSGNSIPASYENTITQYFQDVAADSGKNTNVYSTDPQYTDTSGQGANYDSHYGGYWIDSGTAIPNHCSSQYQGTGISVNGCVLDSDLQTEVLNALSQNSSWSAGMTSIFLVFTPQNVGSCADSFSKDCAFSDYCAYHSYFTRNGSTFIYTNQPYTDTTGVGAPGVCDSGEQPNGSWADETINVASHEQNESITDPLVNAWYDSAGYEDGDKCAWIFGSATGGSGNALYNQTIDGHNYYVQQEWNNAGSNCVQSTSPPPPPPAPTITGLSTSSGSPGTKVTITGTNFTGASSVKFAGTSASFSVTNASTVSTTVPSGAQSGSITVTTAGGTATSSAFTVLPPPPTPDFSLSLGSPTITAPRSSSGTDTVIVTPQNGFTGTVSLSVSGLPGQTSASFSPSSLSNGTGTATLKVSPSRRAHTGTWTLTVTATSGSLKHTTLVTLTIT